LTLFAPRRFVILSDNSGYDPKERFILINAPTESGDLRLILLSVDWSDEVNTMSDRGCADHRESQGLLMIEAVVEATAQLVLVVVSEQSYRD
jgi:hypothetical protein